MKIVLLTWLCVPWAHVANWVVLWSFIPRLYSGILISLLFRLNILLTLTLGSRTHFLLESPDITNDRLLRQKILQILLDVSRDPVPTALQFLTTDNPLNNILAACTFIPSCSCCYKIPLALSVVPRILVPSALHLLFALRIINLTGVRSSPVVHLLSKYLKSLSDLSKSSVAYCSWFSLPACIRINSICLAKFVKILCGCHSVPMNSTCVRILAIIN